MDVPSDLLRDISGRLHAAADFVRFHAVCRSWRDSYSGDVPVSQANRFPPWLLAPNHKDNESIKIRCIFSKASYRTPPTIHKRSWVAGANGTGVRYFTARPYSGLHDPLTGGHTQPLPPFPHESDPWEQNENLGGIVYADGTILLFSEPLEDTFRAALLRPSDAAWTLVERNLPSEYGELCVVYHHGKIMVTTESRNWHVITPHDDAAGDVLVPMTWALEELVYMSGYILETRGELLWVSVHLDLAPSWAECGPVLAVFVYALQGSTEELRWVMKDGRSLTDRVLFLGWPNSFAVDASGRLGNDGGCAYFVYENPCGPGQFGVFKCNLVNRKVEFVEWLPEGWNEEKCTWLIPQPAIAPIPIRYYNIFLG